MISASVYTWAVVPALIIAMTVGAVLWSNASTKRFDAAEQFHRLKTAVVLDPGMDLSGDTPPWQGQGTGPGSNLSTAPGAHISGREVAMRASVASSGSSRDDRVEVARRSTEGA